MKALEAEPLVSVNNILYPTDFSSFAESALPFVCDIARMFRSRVTAVHVRTQNSESLMPPLSPHHQTESTEDLVQRLRGTLDDKLKALDHELLVGAGEVWDFIAHVIKDRDIDLVVIGTQGRTGLEKFMLGSVAELIFRQTNCPVLTIGPHVVHSKRHGWEMSNILLATDFTPESLAACPLAFSLARERHARLTLLHVLERPEAEDLIDPQRYIDSTVRMLQHQVPKAVSQDCQLAYVVSGGKPADEILKVAKESGSDLIVLGVRSASGRLGFATHLVRPTAHQVVSKAPCPVLTVRG
jgi:nucleotide-binding universal stress UspA family protein